ncbi:monovalent cation/H(+) antiporter subunit G [Anaplasma platys]|nr:monovalent cation/H(+) antiporter subunit G [Anaplasma platys]
MFGAFGAGIFYMGIIAVVIAVIGVMRFSDFLYRVHAAGIVDGAGITLSCIGLAFQYGFSILSLKILLLLALLLVTNTTTCNILTGAACSTRGDDEASC